MRIPKIPGLKPKEEKEKKRHSIGRQVNIANGSEKINEVYKRMAECDNFKDVLLYDNLSDDSFLNNYFLGTVYADNERLFSTLTTENPKKDELRESFLRCMRGTQKKYGTDINKIINSYFDNLVEGEAIVPGDIANKVFSSIRVEVDTDFMFVAFMLGHYLQSTMNEQTRNKQQYHVDREYRPRIHSV